MNEDSEIKWFCALLILVCLMLLFAGCRSSKPIPENNDCEMFYTGFAGADNAKFETVTIDW